jgi:hypothetical protein
VPSHRTISATGDVLALVVGCGVIAGLIAWMCTWTGPEGSYAGLDALWILLTSTPVAIAWLAAALGFGWPLRAALGQNTREGLAVQAGAGVAALLWLDAVTARLGLLQWGGSAGAWTLLGIGVALLALQMVRAYRSANLKIKAPNRLIWLAAPGIAVLMLAACSAPGWLWGTEFGGYDALSYHLQLPKEWLALGTLRPVEHNAYSSLPGYVEGAYYHLSVVVGDGTRSVYASQMLHACLAIITGAVVGRAALSQGDRLASIVAFAVFLGTPWTVVVGSLGYNEAAVALMLATGLLVIRADAAHFAVRGALVGLLAGTACGAKLTGVGLVAAPLALLLAWSLAPRRWPAALAAAAVAGTVALAPWLIANSLRTGNPVFPFLTEMLGHGHWTTEQADIWNAGHRRDLGLGGRLVELWNEVLRYGLGENPQPREPWSPQWSILPWLALLGLAVGLSRAALRRRAWQMAVVIVIQVTFWLALTHIQSRFLYPAIVPCALLVAMIPSLGGAGAARRPVTVITAVALLAYGLAPLAVFAQQKDRRPAAAIGAIDVFSGDVHARALDRPDLPIGERLDLLESAPPALWINHHVREETRILCVGEAAPFYYRHPGIVYQTTWDRGPLSRILRAAEGRAAKDMLRAEGFTYVLVDPGMLQRWEDAGWNDPHITADGPR